jgi:hypothetical protein
MSIATCDSRVSENSQHAPDLNQAVVLQRLCSAVMLLLSGASVLFSDRWTSIAAFVAYGVSMPATWLSKRWGGPIWAVCTTSGFVLWAWWQFGGG